MKKNIFLLLTSVILIPYAWGLEYDVLLTKQNMQIPCSIIDVDNSVITYYVWAMSDSVQQILIDDICKIYWKNGNITDYSSDFSVSDTCKILNIKKTTNYTTDKYVIDDNHSEVIANDFDTDKYLTTINNTVIVTISDTTDKATDYITDKYAIVDNHYDVTTNDLVVDKYLTNTNDTVIVTIADTTENTTLIMNKDTIIVKEAIRKPKLKSEVDISELEQDVTSESTFIISGYNLSDVEKRQKALADVHKYLGLYMFNDNEPLCKYIVLGRVKVTMNWSSEYEGVRNHLIKKVLKRYPNADAVLLEMSDGGVDRAAAIKFSDLSEREKWGYAKVNTFNGLFVFSDCEPLNDYTIIGRSKSVITWSGQYDSVKANLIKKALKKLHNAQGIILNMQRGSIDRGVIITF